MPNLKVDWSAEWIRYMKLWKHFASNMIFVHQCTSVVLDAILLQFVHRDPDMWLVLFAKAGRRDYVEIAIALGAKRIDYAFIFGTKEISKFIFPMVNMFSKEDITQMACHNRRLDILKLMHSNGVAVDWNLCYVVGLNNEYTEITNYALAMLNGKFNIENVIMHCFDPEYVMFTGLRFMLEKIKHVEPEGRLIELSNTLVEDLPETCRDDKFMAFLADWVPDGYDFDLLLQKSVKCGSVDAVMIIGKRWFISPNQVMLDASSHLHVEICEKMISLGANNFDECINATNHRFSEIEKPDEIHQRRYHALIELLEEHRAQ